ncbi:PDC sensor domain-containing protein [Brachyspira sp.]|uniref:PDC sensor domain-containing protein n=1 Tax=Brachyspira sp. TaxID=1977261 RepID=UPI003D7EFAA3
MSKIKIKKSHERNGLMSKFLVPFAIFLGIVTISMYIIYRPQYRGLFLNNINTKMKDASEEVLKWAASYYSEIDIIESYTKSSINSNDMFAAFSDIMNKNKEIIDIYFGNTIPKYNDGGIFINLIGSKPDYNHTTREWFTRAVNDRGVYIVSRIASTGERLITLTKAVYTNGYLKGVVGVDVSLAKITETISELGGGGRKIPK